jgi:phage portal protein BeeE
VRLIDSFRTESPAVSERASQLVSSWPHKTTREYLMSNLISYSEAGYKGNSVVFALVQARMDLFTEAEFKFRDLASKRLFGTPDLSKLERPWPGGTTAELLARMEQDVSLAGNAFVRDCGSRLERLRPDWVEIIHQVDELTGADEVIGYLYRREGKGEEIYPVEEVAHWCPIPDPISPFRGMSWLTPVVREIDVDGAMTQHKSTFFEQAATPNIVFKYQRELKPETIAKMREQFDARFAGPGGNKTLWIDQGADLTVVGNSFEQMEFKAIQGAGETRIAAAARVPPIVAGFSEGLDASTYSNYSQALRAFGDNFMRSHWRGACAALSKIVDVPDGARLWYDTTDIAALQEGEVQRAESSAKRASTIAAYLMAGFTAESAVSAVLADDETLLVHTGAISVQLYPQGKAPTNE